VLAGLAISLKGAGMALGWGLHFQSAYFVGFLILVCVAFALSLFGLFHINPPQWAANAKGGNFAAGVLATVLGTSCTAPVLVTAVGFALGSSALNIVLIFGTMGVGMALPFLIFAAYPNLATKILPKPGKWMGAVKKFMGLLLIGTAIWLGTVLYANLKPEPVAAEVQTGIWQKFDEGKVAQLVAEHNVVFVDITAKWCVNCKANKIAVTETPEMLQFFKDQQVILMQGDMTRPSPELLAYIKNFDRYGIPVNVVYGPAAPNGILLDTLLSKTAVKEAIQKAK
jgi:suppressor for copper-sensitivity B